MKIKKTPYLDLEEKSALSPFETLSLKGLKKPTKARQGIYKAAAKNWVKKEAKMNIRVSPTELVAIKEKASDEGLKYQTFVRSIVHKYITGQLVDRNHFSSIRSSH